MRIMNNFDDFFSSGKMDEARASYLKVRTCKPLKHIPILVILHTVKLVEKQGKFDELEKMANDLYDEVHEDISEQVVNFMMETLNKIAEAKNEVSEATKARLSLVTPLIKGLADKWIKEDITTALFGLLESKDPVGYYEKRLKEYEDA